MSHTFLGAPRGAPPLYAADALVLFNGTRGILAPIRSLRPRLLRAGRAVFAPLLPLRHHAGLAPHKRSLDD